MKIAIDCRTLTVQKSGIENYLRHLVDGLKRLDQTNEYWLFHNQDEDDGSPCPPNFHTVFVPHQRSYWYDTWLVHALPPYLRRFGIEVFYCPVNKVPFSQVRKIVTVHGLEWRYFPAGFTLANRVRQWLWLTLSMQHAHRVIAVSDNTRRDILKTFPHLDDKIVVIPEGVDHSLFRVLRDEGSVKAVKAKYGIDGPFLLVVSLLSPRKNTVRLFEALEELIRTHSLKHRLVVVGKEGWLYEDVFRWLERHPNTRSQITLTGHVPDEDLVCLYNAADLLIYPSIYEGFGLPLLEAMACGLPIVASRASSLPEVMGEAGILVNPFSVRSIADGILKGLMDQALRVELRRKGLARARMFSWDLMAQRILTVFESEAMMRSGIGSSKEAKRE